MVKKKPSAKQLAARRKFSRIMKSGGFKKRSKTKKAAKKRVVRGKRTTARRPKRNIVKPRTTRRSRGGSASDVNKSLLLDDIGRMKISSNNKMKIINSISKRLKVWFSLSARKFTKPIVNEVGGKSLVQGEPQNGDLLRFNGATGEFEYISEEEIRAEQLIIMNHNENLSTNDINFTALGGAAAEATSSGIRDAYLAVATTFKKLTINIQSNTLDGSTDIMINNNGVDGNNIVTFPAGITGTMIDETNKDEVSKLDFVNIKYDLTPSGSGTMSLKSMTLVSFQTWLKLGILIHVVAY